MIIDTSALLSVLLAEEDAPVYAHAISEAEHRHIGAPTLFEAAMIVDRRGDGTARELFDRFGSQYDIAVPEFTGVHVALADEAWRRYGKGSGHRAQLNFGDCMAYALSKHRNEPLLFNGNDFNHTDIEPALSA